MNIAFQWYTFEVKWWYGFQVKETATGKVKISVDWIFPKSINNIHPPVFVTPFRAIS